MRHNIRDEDGHVRWELTVWEDGGMLLMDSQACVNVTFRPGEVEQIAAALSSDLSSKDGNG